MAEKKVNKTQAVKEYLKANRALPASVKNLYVARHASSPSERR